MKPDRGGSAALSRILWSAWPLTWLDRAVDGLWELRRRHRTRQQFQMLTDHMCRDIGVSRASALREARKPLRKP